MNRDMSFMYRQGSALEMDLDPRSGVQSPSPSEIRNWLEDDVEVIDLGDEKRDTLIQPTTWHES